MTELKISTNRFKMWRNRARRLCANLAIPAARLQGDQTRPDDYFSCVVGWANSDSRAAGEGYEEIESPFAHDRILTEGLLNSPLGEHFRGLWPGVATRQFRLVLKNARVYGMRGVVVHQSNRIFAELTFEYATETKDLSFWNAVKIPQVKEKKGRVGVAHSMSCENYSHWVMEVVPQLIRLKHDLENGEIDWIYVRYEKDYQKEWIDLIGIDPDRIIKAGDDNHIAAETMVVYSMPMRNCDFSKKQLEIFRTLVDYNAVPPTRKKIFVGREGGNRSFALSDGDLKSVVEECGYEYLLMENLSVKEKIRKFTEASVIAGPHGAGLGGLVFLQPASAELREIHSPLIPNLCYWRIADTLSLQYSTMLGTIVPKSAAPKAKKVHRPITVSASELRCFLAN